MGIVLAGGLASRLPNKLLLPDRHDRPIIHSSIDFLKRNGIEHIIVVANELDLVWAYLWNYDGYSDITMINDDRAGIVGAILKATEHYHYERCMVVCGDNVYPEIALDIPLEQDIAVCTLRGSEELDGWEDGWVERGKLPLIKLATPWVLTLQKLTTNKSLFENFDAMKVKPLVLESFLDSWWDLGTQDAYEAYLAEGHDA